jgi:polyisoprenoid-binding protein YceI
MLGFCRTLVTAFLLTALLGQAYGQSLPYIFDSKRGEVRFSYSMPLSTGHGRFSRLEGSAHIDDAAPANSSVEVIIDARTLRADTSWAEGELRGRDFFAVASHPQMNFKSRSVRPQSPTTQQMTGDMTVRGITRPIVLQVSMQPPAADGTREFRATTRIRRGDFGMTAYAVLVGETVQIEIRGVLVPAR